MADCTSLGRFLSYVNHVDKWKLMHREFTINTAIYIDILTHQTPKWKPGLTKPPTSSSCTPPSLNLKEPTNISSGDSCHPMLPYLAQGANSSLEDGAVLGHLLGSMKSKTQLPRILRLYETLRKSRGEAIVQETFKQVRLLFYFYFYYLYTCFCDDMLMN